MSYFVPRELVIEAAFNPDYNPDAYEPDEQLDEIHSDELKEAARKKKLIYLKEKYKNNAAFRDAKKAAARKQKQKARNEKLDLKSDY